MLAVEHRSGLVLFAEAPDACRSEVKLGRPWRRPARPRRDEPSSRRRISERTRIGGNLVSIPTPAEAAGRHQLPAALQDLAEEAADCARSLRPS